MEPFCVWKEPNVEYAMKIAISNRNIDMVRFFLDSEPTLDVNYVETTSLDGGTFLTTAIDHGAEDIVELLLVRGADVNLTPRFSSSPLSCASKEDLVVVVKRLLELGADPSFVGQTGPSPLKGAVVSRSIPIMQLLLDHGANVEVMDTFDNDECEGPPLEAAVTRNYLPEAEFLIQEGHANINFVSESPVFSDLSLVSDSESEDKSLILRALSHGYLETASLLLTHGATIGGEESPFSWVASSGNVAALQWLVDHGVDARSFSLTRKSLGKA